MKKTVWQISGVIQNSLARFHLCHLTELTFQCILRTSHIPHINESCSGCSEVSGLKLIFVHCFKSNWLTVASRVIEKRHFVTQVKTVDLGRLSLFFNRDMIRVLQWRVQNVSPECTKKLNYSYLLCSCWFFFWTRFLRKKGSKNSFVALAVCHPLNRQYEAPASFVSKFDCHRVFTGKLSQNS